MKRIAAFIGAALLALSFSASAQLPLTGAGPSAPSGGVIGTPWDGGVSWDGGVNWD
jgi:Spy/CpxP family protein refolding chaperone